MRTFTQKFKTILKCSARIKRIAFFISAFLLLVQPVFAVNVLFYYYNDGGLGTDLKRIGNALTFYGYTVTTINVAAAGYLPGGAGNSAVAGDNWASYDQVWDGRFNGVGDAGCPAGAGPDNFDANWQATAVDYVEHYCGNIYLQGENSGYMERNQGNYQFLQTAGGIKPAFVACGAPSVNGTAFGGTACTCVMTGPAGLAGVNTYFADEGGIPNVAPNYLNGSSLVSFPGASYADGVARSAASVWTGTAQLESFTGCNVGSVVIYQDMDQWSGCCYSNPVGGNTADGFVQAVALYFFNHPCVCTTPTFTNTPTNTDTRTPSPTFTNTFTPTITNTFTNTFTPTNSFTPTNTFTATPTNTYTSTFTNTFTPTNTPTFTNTFTNTYTSTDTYTPTNTDTPTFVNTPTFTNTFTNTFTQTFTDTWTNTFTPTNTDTATLMNTPTSTNTFTNTYTFTPTATPTFTFTSTPTSTYTNTFTSTFTSTDTNTPVFTATATNTFTATDTNTVTSTFTPTFTPTHGVSMGKNVSKTQVHEGDTLTYSIGITVTGNTVAGPVVTDTLPAFMNFVAFGTSPAGTTSAFNPNTDQLQWNLPTLSPGIYTLTYTTRLGNFAPANVPLTNFAQLNYPGSAGPLTSSVPVTVIGNFTVSVNIYNSAGEIVKTITVQTFTQPINSITLSASNTITTLNGPGSTIEILFEGIVIGTWNGTNNSNQPVSNGTYSIQIDSTGTTGVVTSVAQNAIVDRVLANITANVYNEAGELVRSLYYLVDDPINTSMFNVTLSSNVIRPSLSAPVTNGVPNLATIYIQTSGTPVTLTWDGTNAASSVVSPGVYSIQIHWHNGNGQTTDISRQVMVIASTTITGIAVAKPNILGSATTLTTTFDATGVLNASGLKIRIYTVAGELVQTLYSSTPTTTWTVTGLASGIYIANVEMDSANSGVIGRQFLKILVLH